MMISLQDGQLVNLRDGGVRRGGGTGRRGGRIDWGQGVGRCSGGLQRRPPRRSPAPGAGERESGYRTDGQSEMERGDMLEVSELCYAVVTREACQTGREGEKTTFCVTTQGGCPAT